MRIDQYKCVACGNCIPVCPVGAIYIDPAVGRAQVNRDECVECHACYRGMSKEHLSPPMVRAIRRFAKAFRFRFDPEPDVCPTDALTPEDLTWPRIVRRAFSDPQVPHESTGIHGRGTAEVKTNDVTGRVKEGEAGFVIEFGRPGVGARFREIQNMTTALAALGVEFEKQNPVTSLMSEPRHGLIRPDILDEKVLSAIVEVKTGLEQVPRVLRTVRRVARGLPTVVSVGVSTRCDPAGDDRLREILTAEGYPAYRGKTNVGLGRTTVDLRAAARPGAGAPAPEASAGTDGSFEIDGRAAGGRGAPAPASEASRGNEPT